MDTEPRTTRTTGNDDDEEDMIPSLPRTQRRLARGVLDATTELWSGGFRVFGNLLLDVGDSINRPTTSRRRRGGAGADEPGSTFIDNSSDMVEAVTQSLSDGISGAASTLQRSLNIVAESISPEEEDEEETTKGAPRRRRRGRTRSAPAPTE